MEEYLDDKLCADFPNLYADRNKSCQETCMCWGFPGAGWEPLLRELSEKLEALIVEWKAQNPGCDSWPRASQVKEKYGGLRYYMTSSTDEMDKLIDIAEQKSYETCEVCGKPGECHGAGWLATTCLEHTSKETLAAEASWYKERCKELEKELEEVLFDKEVDETLAASLKPEEQT